MRIINCIFFLVGFVFLIISCDNNFRENQTISFDYFAPHNLSEGSIQLTATASSGLPISYISSDPTIAQINNNVLNLLKIGIVDITAFQSGNEKYYEAANITRTLQINDDTNIGKRNQTITFELNDTVWKLSYGPLILRAFASSGLPVTFTSSNIVYAAITGNALTITSGNEGAGIIITASQAGNDEYNAAPTVSRPLKVYHDIH